MADLRGVTRFSRSLPIVPLLCFIALVKASDKYGAAWLYFKCTGQQRQTVDERKQNHTLDKYGALLIFGCSRRQRGWME